MTLKALTTTAASAVVLAAATAGMATAKATPRHTGAKPGKATAVKAPKTKPVIYTAPFGPTPIHTPRYIYVPAGTPDPNAPPAAQDCTTTPDACTDPADLCEYWGIC